MRFEELNLDSRLLRAIADRGYTETTDVQSRTLAVTLPGGDAAVIRLGERHDRPALRRFIGKAREQHGLRHAALADAGHIVYASMRETRGRNAPQVAAVQQYAAEHGVDLRTVELDVASDKSVEAAIAKIVADNGRLDVVVHNAGHMSFGPAEAFTPQQFAQL